MIRAKCEKFVWSQLHLHAGLFAFPYADMGNECGTKIPQSRSMSKNIDLHPISPPSRLCKGHLPCRYAY